MQAIPLGAKGKSMLIVGPEHLANRFKDAMLPPVLATPIMVLVMENAALDAIRGYLEPGESALGTLVDVRHVAATPVGQCVTAEAEVTQFDGRRIVFAVTAHDEVEEIGRGTHERTVVDLRRLTRRLLAKACQGEGVDGPRNLSSELPEEVR
jgi:fluoroacetyl-CoA thioesterase